MKGCFVRSFRLSQGAAYNENEAAASELGQQLGVAAAKADTLSSVPWTHMLGGENWLRHVILRSPLTVGQAGTHRHRRSHRVNKQL